ncbi:hypothetical protein LOD99_13922 [Oopsacas minuta]|uniref:DNA-directed RNA polymerase III subunit RPC8 n=1 Tax=Oopsacas minuta TaxID=111878 RepID=A0AAV7KJH3_9METZ|nr:hypothetical protein LOD99_13922 [Oopsacas minuta]
MFQLVHMRDVIMIPPHRLGWELTKHLRDQLAIKYGNKVIYNIGLVIALFDILDMTEPVVLPGQPDVIITLEFRVIVFRPFIGEVLNGHVFKSTHEGVHVHVDFFHDILITQDCLPQDSVWQENEQVWVWKYKVEDNTHDLYIDKGEPIRFSITKEKFVDIAVDKKGQDDNKETELPYKLYAQITDPGLGLLTWWN